MTRNEHQGTSPEKSSAGHRGPDCSVAPPYGLLRAQTRGEVVRLADFAAVFGGDIMTLASTLVDRLRCSSAAGAPFGAGDSDAALPEVAARRGGVMSPPRP
mmetsp:Transcript_74726/g.211132  ORF Transcript_74726/g.211132 Transcript_74726/m.211132 type:complete len:101 (-) Transcript_74726:642-944(-)